MIRSPIRAAGPALALVLLLSGGTSAQELTVERIFASSELSPEGLPELEWTPSGQGFAFVQGRPDGEGTDLVHYDVASGQASRLVDGSRLVPPGETAPVPIEGYQWSPDGRMLLIYTRSQRVWRQNTKGVYFIYWLDSGRMRPLSTRFGWQQFAKFSPDSRKVGFVRENDLFVVDVESGRETRLTHDGGENVINGTFDWVYEEELGLRDGWRWSPDSRKIAFWRLDQTPVKTFNMIDNLRLYAEPVPIRYPKTGDPNSVPAIGVLDLAGDTTRWMDLGPNPDVYPARMEWARSSDEILVQRMNRLQNRIDVMLFDQATGKGRVLFSEVDEEAWVDVDDDLRWVRDGGELVWTSMRDGYNHIYLYGRDGALVRQLTDGDWDVRSIQGVSGDGARVYFTASVESPLQTHLYRVPVDGGSPEQLTEGDGSHDPDVSPTGSFFVDEHSRIGDPPRISLHRGDGREVRELVDNARLRETLSDLPSPEFFTFVTSEGVELNGWMIRPDGFDEDREYPAVMYVYGGPGSQTVEDGWGGSRYLWHLLLAERGYVVASVDNRGTGGRGRDFYKMTYMDLGNHETADQMEAARHLASLPFVDGDRIGIWGWSYGGYMTLLSTMKGGDLFRTGISVAPVTHWKFYDTIYTERYMRTPRTNPDGYARSAPLNLANGLTADLLLVHGSGDDNVHFQNSVQMVQRLQAAGKQFEFMMYPGKTHSISGADSRTHLYGMMLEFLEGKLRGAGDGTAATP